MAQQKHKVFVCHASQDKKFACDLAGALRDEGITVWIDETGVRHGDSFTQQIEEALRTCEVMCVVLSPDAVASTWVAREIEAALERESAGEEIRIIPVLYRDCEVPLFLKTKSRLDLRGRSLTGRKLREGARQLALSIASPGLVPVSEETVSRSRSRLVVVAGVVAVLILSVLVYTTWLGGPCAGFFSLFTGAPCAHVSAGDRGCIITIDEAELRDACGESRTCTFSVVSAGGEGNQGECKTGAQAHAVVSAREKTGEFSVRLTCFDPGPVAFRGVGKCREKRLLMDR